eukprot:TRINITY_DN6728_c0_g1_i1.p1 TRINITY_DN6728_c0_g1~~TRINITY_DN6728_c0_g1_i1.p1  ORF type:complete len:573 (+),score=17.58 TRINITY_DN6728_c0_g1_i1:2-1720(+)
MKKASNRRWLQKGTQPTMAGKRKPPKEVCEESRLITLPIELKRQICSLMQKPELIQFKNVCKEFHTLILQSYLIVCNKIYASAWRRRFANDEACKLAKLLDGDAHVTALNITGATAEGLQFIASILPRSVITNLSLSQITRNSGINMEQLEELLRHNITLRSLEISASNLCADIKSTGAMLASNSTLTELKIVCPKWQAKVAIGIANSLESCALTSVNLRDCTVSDAFANAILKLPTKGGSLTSLNLFRTNLSDKGAKCLSEVLRHNSILQHLNVGNSVVITKKGHVEIVSALEQNSTLTSLDLSGFRGDSGTRSIFHSLAKNSTLTVLNLRGSSISEDEMAIATYLESNYALRDLDLRETVVMRKERVEIALAKNTVLTSLKLSECRLSAIAKLLESNSTLRSICLDYSKSKSGIPALAASLTKNSTLESLFFLKPKDDLKDPNSEVFADFIAGNRSIKSLGIQQCIDRSEALCIAAALRKNTAITYLDISDNYKLSLDDRIEIMKSVLHKPHFQALVTKKFNTTKAELSKIHKIIPARFCMDLDFDSRQLLCIRRRMVGNVITKYNDFFL